jgi:transposase
VIDLLNLPGVKPVDYFSQNRGLTVVAEALDGDLPSCPDCTKAMYRHGKRSNIFADTPMQMPPLRFLCVKVQFNVSQH